MHDGRLRADAGDDEIAVPGRELLERVEQLLALGAARCALHPLLGLAGRQLEPSSAASASSRAVTARPRAASSTTAAASDGSNPASA